MTGGWPIVSAAQMRAAELAAVAAGTPLSDLMDNAGRSLAELAYRIASGRPIHILAGRGNNGGDGYAAATWLRRAGVKAIVSAAGPPATGLAIAAAREWGEVARTIDEAPVSGAILVDCLFGTGLNRDIGSSLAQALAGHAAAAHQRIAADLPSGVSCDDGQLLGCPYHADITLAFGAQKAAHLLFPAAAHCGTVRVADIGITPRSDVQTATMPALTFPDHDSHKYRRGLVCVVAGAMPGAAELAARAAARCGAGYVRILSSRLPASAPFSIVRSGRGEPDERAGAIVIGPGLGRGDAAQQAWNAAIASGKPMVVDADALAIARAHGPLPAPVILTPHAGEFDSHWPGEGNKISRTSAAAALVGGVIIHKGAASVIAAPDGRVAVHSPGSPWLASAGTGDVLAGICGAMLASGLAPFEAAQAAVLLHQRAAQRAGPGLIADDLVKRPIWP